MMEITQLEQKLVQNVMKMRMQMFLVLLDLLWQLMQRRLIQM